MEMLVTLGMARHSHLPSKQLMDFVRLIPCTFELCGLIEVGQDLWRSLVQPLFQQYEHLSQIRHWGSCPGEF